MPRKAPPYDLDDVIRAYERGRRVEDIAAEIGVSAKTLYDRFRRVGYKVHGRKPSVVLASRRQDIDTDEIVRLYRGGESVKAIADRLGTSRDVVTRRLRDRDIEPRGRSEAEALKWSRMTSEQRAAQVAAAHEAARGREPTVEELEAHAKWRQCNRTVNVSDAEVVLARMLADMGLATLPQLAVGPYNCDLAATPVAVEVFGGNWHFSGRHGARLPQRLRYFGDRGWSVLMVVIGRRAPLTREVADYVAAYVERARSDPTFRREYRVIRGAGETLAAGSLEGDDLPVIVPNHSA